MISFTPVPFCGQICLLFSWVTQQEPHSIYTWYNIIQLLEFHPLSHLMFEKIAATTKKCNIHFRGTIFSITSFKSLVAVILTLISFDFIFILLYLLIEARQNAANEKCFTLVHKVQFLFIIFFIKAFFSVCLPPMHRLDT